MCTYNVAQFIHSRKWENVKTWIIWILPSIKKKKKNPYIILYLTIITVRIVARSRYSTNQPLFPFFTRCVSPPPIVVARSTNTSNVSPSLIGESERDIPWKVKKLARRELGMHTGNGIRYGGHFAHSMYHGPKMDCRGNASWIPFIFRNRPRF